MGKNTPKDFDVDAWLDGLSRPQRSVRVYQRGDIMAQLDDQPRRSRTRTRSMMVSAAWLMRPRRLCVPSMRSWPRR